MEVKIRGIHVLHLCQPHKMEASLLHNNVLRKHPNEHQSTCKFHFHLIFEQLKQFIPNIQDHKYYMIIQQPPTLLLIIPN